MDAEPNRADSAAGLLRVEGQVRHQGPALLLAAELLPAEHAGVAGGDAASSHLHGVPQQLPLDPRPHGRRLQLLVRSSHSASPSIIYDYLNTAVNNYKTIRLSSALLIKGVDSCTGLKQRLCRSPKCGQNCLKVPEIANTAVFALSGCFRQCTV